MLRNCSPRASACAARPWAQPLKIFYENPQNSTEIVKAPIVGLRESGALGQGPGAEVCVQGAGVEHVGHLCVHAALEVPRGVRFWGLGLRV